ncbi:MAG: DEAD/DEAH box helicase [Halanaerobiales bacterium]|nr:DEAD/DEAH box helicase [Halanaerobiales bacterium]
MKIIESFDNKIKEKIKDEINEANGNEVFFCLEIDFDQEKIKNVVVMARGNKSMAPAVIETLPKNSMVLHNHPSGDTTPSGPDINVASKLGNKGIGFVITDNKLNDIYVLVEPKEIGNIENINLKQILNYFKDDGEISSKMQDFEYRTEQLEITESIVNSFNNQEHTLIEAGTGIGKTFAYLIPAIYWAVRNKEPVVISTNTINLQQQIMDKDIEFLKKVLPFDFKADLALGRKNYLCIRKLKNIDNYLNDSSDLENINKIINWAKNTKKGIRNEINFNYDKMIWDEVASDNDYCIGTLCSFYDDCYFMKARNQLFNSDLIVVNHYLLLSDAVIKSSGYSTLPKYKSLIIDEAHNFHDVATYHLGNSTSYKLNQQVLKKLYDKKYSIIPRIRNKISEIEIDNKKEIYSLIDNSIIPKIKDLEENNKEYFIMLDNFFNKFNKNNIILDSDLKDDDSYQEINKYGFKFHNNFEELLTYLKNLINQLKFIENYDKIKSELLELKQNLNTVNDIVLNLLFNLEAKDDDYVFWLEKYRKHDKYISHISALLNVDKHLPEMLWDKLRNAIFTSATLTVNDSFKYFIDALGIKNYSEHLVNSPFNYEKQSRLIIPNDIYSPTEGAFISNIADDLTDILKTFNGSTMVLFTSYKMLDNLYERIKYDLEEKNIKILSQSKYSRKYIIDRFKAGEKQIIFGTQSFWEGVDIVGKDLKYLIIMRLPFPVPDDPVNAARVNMLRKEGKNYFFDYFIPKAVIKFKQGFGRLIRSKNDKGIVICMDNRLINKRYGEVFINSIPDRCPVLKMKLRKIIDYVAGEV